VTWALERGGSVGRLPDFGSRDPVFNSQSRKVIFHNNLGQVVNLYLLMSTKLFMLTAGD
jgi:hypothetical protein